MATHSSILAWRIPWTEEPGKLRSIVSESRTLLKLLSTHAHNQKERRSKWRVLPLGFRGSMTLLTPWFQILASKPILLLTQLYLTLCNPLDCSPPGSAVHGTFQVRRKKKKELLEPVPTCLTQGSNPHLLCLLNCRWILYPHEPSGKPPLELWENTSVLILLF